MKFSNIFRRRKTIDALNIRLAQLASDNVRMEHKLVAIAKVMATVKPTTKHGAFDKIRDILNH